MGQWELCFQIGVFRSGFSDRGFQIGVFSTGFSDCRLAMDQVVDRVFCVPLEPGGGFFRPHFLRGAVFT